MKKTMICVKNLAYSYTKEAVLTDVNFELMEKSATRLTGANVAITEENINIQVNNNFEKHFMFFMS